MDGFLSQTESESVDSSPGMTPMIDVVFQLLVFFMLTSSFANPSLEIDLPDQETPLIVVTEEYWLLEICSDGVISFERERVEVDFSVFLQQWREHQNGDKPIALRIDEKTAYRDIAAVMQTLGEAGLSKFFFIYESGEF